MMQNVQNQSFPPVIKKGPYTSEVIENRKISEDIYILKLRSPEITQNALPGQFVSIKCKDLLLRRPFSVAKVYDDDTFALIYKVIGEGTQFLTGLKPGNTADFIGPMGNSFTIEDKNPLLIGCGVGIAPIIYLAQKMDEKGIKYNCIIGTRTSIDLDPISNPCFLTEDGTCGLKGRLDHHLEDIIAQTGTKKIYICGPNPAMIYATRAAKKHGIEIEVALEKVMACGTGVCMGCVTEITENGEKVQRRVCRDGPIFNGANIIWE